MKIEYTHSGSTHLHHEYSMYRSLEGIRKYHIFFSSILKDRCEINQYLKLKNNISVIHINILLKPNLVENSQYYLLLLFYYYSNVNRM